MKFWKTKAKDLEESQKYVIIKNDIFKRIEKELNNEDFTEQEVE